MRSLAVVLILCGSSLQAGEWMFRLRDAHVQLRRALAAQDADAVWEQVDRSTRQEAGRWAAHVRRSFDGLPESKRAELRETLGIDDDRESRSLTAKRLLVADVFVAAHPELLVGDPADAKLKDHGTKMAGPTAIVVAKQTPEETLVPYRFTVQSHFGGQAMDYRAQLAVPSLGKLLGPLPPLVEPSEEESARAAVALFEQARRAFATGDVEALWPLLDCDSQSQASHFADQARERAGKSPEQAAEIAAKLGIDESEVAALDGRAVWALPWSREELVYLAEATNPRFTPMAEFDSRAVPIPVGYEKRKWPKGQAEMTVAFENGGRTWQLPVRWNVRDGEPRMTILLNPPYYLRLRR